MSKPAVLHYELRNAPNPSTQPFGADAVSTHKTAEAAAEAHAKLVKQARKGGDQTAWVDAVVVAVHEDGTEAIADPLRRV